MLLTWFILVTTWHQIWCLYRQNIHVQAGPVVMHQCIVSRLGIRSFSCYPPIHISYPWVLSFISYLFLDMSEAPFLPGPVGSTGYLMYRFTSSNFLRRGSGPTTLLCFATIYCSKFSCKIWTFSCSFRSWFQSLSQLQLRFPLMRWESWS